LKNKKLFVRLIYLLGMLNSAATNSRGLGCFELSVYMRGSDLMKTLRTSFLVVGLAAGAACLAGASPAQAMVIFDNTNNLTDSSNDAWSVSGSGSFTGSDVSIGSQFNAGAGGTLSQIDVNVSRFPGSGSIRFDLFSDNAGQLGTSLANFSLSSVTFQQLYYSTTTFSATPTLTAGANYWLIASTESGSDNFFGWTESSNDPSRSMYFNQGGMLDYRTARSALFRVSVNSGTSSTAVPVPPQFVATVVGAGLSALKLRQGKLTSASLSQR
jgi:hypothetical protein